MNFIPQYFPPDPEHHFPPYSYQQQYFVDRGDMPPQDLESSSMNHQSSSSSQHCSQQGEDAGSVSQKEQEETDTSSRPRLTSEQTSVLEKHFQKESKPVTEVKKRLAQQVGLPLDKVNNWYQNRRAKAKHLKKLRYLEFRPYDVSDGLYHRSNGYPDLMSPLYGPPAYFGPEAFSMQPQPPPPSDLQALYTSMLGSHTPLEHPQPRDPAQVWARLPDLDHTLQAQLDQENHDNMMNERFMESQQANGYGTEIHDENLHATAFPGWENGHHDSRPWTASHTAEDQFVNTHQQMLMQQEAPPLFNPVQNVQLLDDNISSPHSMLQHTIYGHDSNESSQTVLALQAHETQAQQPEATIFATMQHHSPPTEQISRTSSHHSSLDLTESFNNIDFQKVRTPVKTEDTEDNTSVHASNLAIRRNRQRPPTLGLRSHSATSPQRSSPGVKPLVLGPSNSVRRIKSMGNSLNVLSGRIQKTTQAQKSPLHFTTFQEAGGFDHNDQSLTSNIKAENSPSSELTPQTSHDPSMGMDGVPMDWPPADVVDNHGLQLSEHPSHSKHTASRSVSGSQQQQIMSPPHTPFNQEMHRYSYMPSGPCGLYTAPPQSAPPYLTSFPQHSPPQPQQVTPVTPAGYFAPQFNLSEAYHSFYPGPAFHVQQQQPQMTAYLPSQQPGVHFHPPHIMGGSPSIGGHNMFYPPPPAPPVKEMEFVQMQFPEPPKIDPASKEPYPQKVFAFHHMSPSDIANASK